MAIMVEEKYTTEIAAPKVIDSDAQNEKYIAILARLQRQEQLTDDEKNYAQLLVMLIKAYEDRRYRIGRATPLQVLKELVEANDLQHKDLIPAFGSKSAVSDALSGRRPFSKRHILNLSRRFHVSPAVFFG